MYAKTTIENVFKQNSMAWDIDTPKYLKEVIECSGQQMYRQTWNVLLWYLKAIAQRATEINDPILNALMIRMNMYEVPLNERNDILKKLEIEYNNKVRKH